MKIKFITTVLLVFFGWINSSIAQHCPFDGAYILVIEPTSKKDTVAIPNLEVSFIYNKRYRFGNEVEQDTVSLWQNSTETTHSGIIDNENPMNPWSIRFPFAEDNYVLVFGFFEDDAQVQIVDADGDQNGGHFETKTVSVTKSNFYSLCTGNSNWDLGEEGGFVEGYEPIKVTLKKAK